VEHTRDVPFLAALAGCASPEDNSWRGHSACPTVKRQNHRRNSKAGSERPSDPGRPSAPQPSGDKGQTGMTAMNRMFCTLKEAAETLNASEDQINTLLERGILREFRDGPHRLLRQADIGALDLRRTAPSNAQPTAGPPAQSPVRTRRPSPRGRGKLKASRPIKRKTSHGRPAISRLVRQQRKEHPRQGAQDRGLKAERRLKCEVSSCRTARIEPQPSSSPTAVLRPISPAAPGISVRQWLWMGLVQDRPAAIALLAGLVLLGFSALVAGICLLAERL
jgi:excisionase family DNA binding protein